MTDDVATFADDVVGDSARHASVVRHEQRLTVATERYATELVRVSKVIVTEERTITVTVRREELHVTREPALPDTPFGSGSGPDAAELVITLHAEVPVVTMQVVPVEQVRVHRTTITDVQAVTDTLDQERVDIHSTPTTDN